ncbi:restriction endonuclease subunit S [Delftia acidovorans]|uniref:restriction endonuclease subunit S n=1 Tax=Delftia acidovorans TaxID=80866 RepID=UPI0032DF3A23
MLLSNLDLLAIAPGGVARLREFILTLAVQGKLVPQDPADEPASALVKTIRAEKGRLTAEGKSKRDKPLAEIKEEEKPFELPVGWDWVRLADVVRVLNGRAYGKQELLDTGPVRVLRVGNLFTSKHWYYSDLELESEKYCEEGDLLYAWSASFGPFIWQGPRAIFHYHIWKLEPWAPHCFDVGYFHKFLAEKTAEIKATGHGVSMVHMTKEKMEKIVVPYPPLAEQSRIVTRVEELMRLCDALDAKGKLESTQHAQLVSTLLGTLTSSATPEELADNWQRVAQHFDLLLDRPEAIDALEQTLLQLAVRGLLVPQDPIDETASTLLARIRSEKERLISQGKIKRDKPLPPISDEEKPFELPVGWEWVRMGEAFDGGSGTTPLRTRTDFFLGGTEMWVKTTDLTNSSVTTCEELITKAAVEENRLRYFPSGTVCIAMYGGAGTIGKSGVLGVSSTVNQSVFALTPTEGMNSDFLHTYVITVRPRWMSFAAGLRKDPNINGQIIKKMVMPIPPSAEQSRIVTRITALRRLCDDLRQRLKAAQITQSHLAQALVESSNAL